MLSYDGHPLNLTCPQCQLIGTAWFSADEALHLRIDQIPSGFSLVERDREAIGPQFTCLTCNVDVTPL